VTLTYYVYYRVPTENTERVRTSVEAIQRELSDTTGVAGRLLKRRDDASTWMEVYENVPDAVRFEAQLAALVERHALAALLAPGSSRKLEIFRDF